MLYIRKLFFIVLAYISCSVPALELSFDGSINRLEQNERDELIVRWEGGERKLSEILGQEGMNMKTIAVFNAQPAILYDSISSSVKSKTYYTLKMDSDNIVIDCMYYDAVRGELFDRYGVCNLNIILDTDYIDNVYEVANAGGLNFYAANPFDVDNFEDFLKNGHWPLTKKLYEYDSMYFNLEYSLT